jgi:hypothetical protein
MLQAVSPTALLAQQGTNTEVANPVASQPDTQTGNLYVLVKQPDSTADHSFALGVKDSLKTQQQVPPARQGSTTSRTALVAPVLSTPATTRPTQRVVCVPVQCFCKVHTG